MALCGASLSAHAADSNGGSAKLGAKSSAASPHAAVAATAPASEPKVDPTSLSSVEAYVKYLRTEYRKEARANSGDKPAPRDAHRQGQRHILRQAAQQGPSVGLASATQPPKKKTAKGIAPKLIAWEAYLYWLRPRVFPGNTLDMSAYARAAAARDAMPNRFGPAGSPGGRASINSLTPGGGGSLGGGGSVGGSGTIGGNGNAVVVQPNWSSIGPNGTSGGQVSWRTSQLTYDPQDPTHYFAAGSRGGVWESHDSGNTWTPITDFQPMLPVSCVTVDPLDSSTIYIGTGDYDSPGSGYGLVKGRWDGTRWNFTVNAVNIVGTTPIRRITVDPLTASKVFATCGKQGLIMSTDRGGTWRVVLGPNTTPAVTGSFSNVVYNSQADRIWACADGPGGGIFQSLNGGVTWAAIPGAPSPAGRIDIAASPLRTLRGKNTFYAILGSEQQVLKCSPTPNTAGAPEPSDNDTGAIQFINCVNFPTTAPGAVPVWNQANSYNLGIGVSTTGDRVTVTDNGTPPHIATVSREIVVAALVDLHVSLDSGQLWRTSTQPDVTYPYNSGVSGGISYRTLQQVPTFDGPSGSVADPMHSVTINPKNPFEFLVGSDGGAYRLTVTPGPEPGGPVGGVHFEIPKPIPNPLPTPPAPPGPPIQHDYELYESVDNIFDFYIVPNPYNTGASFAKPLGQYSITPINNGLGIAQFFTLGDHPTDPVTTIGGTMSNGAQYSFGSIDTWDFLITGVGGACGINQFTPNIQFASVFFKEPNDPLDEPFYPTFRTDDSWNTATDQFLFTGDDITAFLSTGEMSRSNPNLFYMSTNYIYQFDENVQDWVKLLFQFTPLGTVSAIETTPASIHYLYVATTDGFLYYSSNADNDPGPDQNLVTFTEIDRQGAIGGLPVRSITGISASSTNPKQIFVTMAGTGTGGKHVFMCSDITARAPQWNDITNNLPDISANTICVFPRNNSQEIAVGTDVGVFYTVNQGANWVNITAPLSLPNAQVNKLYFTPGTNFLNAATFGRGVWHLDLTNPLINGGAGGGGGGLGPPPPNVTLNLLLQSYVGSRTKLTANIQVFQGAALVQNLNLPLNASGQVKFTLPSIGTYDILISVPGFLHKRLKNQLINADITLSPTLLNGDVNHDNLVSNLDLTQAQRKLGQFTTGPEDVDGDGQVTQNDLNIITRNLGQIGDN